MIELLKKFFFKQITKVEKEEDVFISEYNTFAKTLDIKNLITLREIDTELGKVIAEDQLRILSAVIAIYDYDIKVDYINECLAKKDGHRLIANYLATKITEDFEKRIITIIRSDNYRNRHITKRQNTLLTLNRIKNKIGIYLNDPDSNWAFTYLKDYVCTLHKFGLVRVGRKSQKVLDEYFRDYVESASNDLIMLFESYPEINFYFGTTPEALQEEADE